MSKNNSGVENELDHILDFYSIVWDRDAIKKDIMEIIEREKSKAYQSGVESITLSPDYSGTIGGSSLDE